MRDEFNRVSGCHDLSEYSNPQEDRIPVEYSAPVEYTEVNEQADAKEYNEEIIGASLKKTGNSDRKKCHKFRLMSYLVAAGAAVIVITNASAITGTLKKTPEPVITGEWGYANDVYVSKPELPNLNPNGPVTVPEYGLFDTVLDEEYLVYAQDGNNYVLWLGSRRNGTVSEGTENIYYDYDSNTLHLNNCSIDSLEVNLMGNSFTVEVEGICHVGTILMWGFYYGGSITFTGESGTLYINEDEKYDFGIQMMAEYSTSGIFVDKMNGLYIYGAKQPVLIVDTEMEHAVYWKTVAMKLQDDCEYISNQSEDGIYNVSLFAQNSMGPGDDGVIFLPFEHTE